MLIKRCVINKSRTSFFSVRTRASDITYCLITIYDCFWKQKNTTRKNTSALGRCYGVNLCRDAKNPRPLTDRLCGMRRKYFCDAVMRRTRPHTQYTFSSARSYFAPNTMHNVKFLPVRTRLNAFLFYFCCFPSLTSGPRKNKSRNTRRVRKVPRRFELLRTDAMPRRTIRLASPISVKLPVHVRSFRRFSTNVPLFRYNICFFFFFSYI